MVFAEKKKMGRTKTTSGQPSNVHKVKRVMIDSTPPDPPPRSLFKDSEKQKRYEEISNWSFISERRGQLMLEKFDPFLDGLMRRNLMRLAEPMPKYDPEVVYEFYVNAWTGSQGSQ